ncbi:MULTISPECIES: AI-2E family transporter [unclassified Dysgonomonas]|uniref:AI-2E family transporter n=1 Tax=unclassified Dysgonomonas TaxID=2630389 RepID=UPI0006800C89|nr:MULTISPECIES: AI-2E family transporter [unclassified Dysgonomonas]MBD8349231.1 AI-2E family transporter [Dysgonomonas sp. HGC4]MBF0576730.1 AI-2E family transporter [Dysgonomonas sp. GY617]
MRNSFDRPFTFDRVIRLSISVILIGLGIYMIYILRSVLLPFLVAWLMAYLLNPVVRFIKDKLRLKKRVVAVLITFAMLIGVLTLFFFCITPLVENELYQINSLITSYDLQSFTVNGMPLSVHDFIAKNIDFDSLRNVLSKENASDTIRYLIPTLENMVSNSISFILGFTVVFIIILYLIFILLDYDKINKLWMDLIPHRHRAFVSRVTVDVERSMNTYFRHQALICVIVAILFATGFQIIGLPLAIVLGILIGFLHMVPYMHIISIVPAALLCWLKVSQTGESFWALIGLVILLYLVIQCIIDIILVPRIMGKAMGLNPAIILLSLSIWGSLMGIAGMIIAIPLTTLLLSYYQQFIDSEEEVEGGISSEKSDKELSNE